ncbi:MAG: DNA/RNA nuclease SfsA [FCB group bacterium]|nr:DNA/RNA nuclease SfsA [FCB group bacterium]
MPTKFIDRPNRFLIRVQWNRRVVECHCPDPGRLKELLLPGAEIWIRPEQKAGRKTSATTVLVRAGSPDYPDGPLVCLVSALPNKFVKELLESGDLPGYAQYRLIRTEIPYQNHRFDFLLNDPDGHPYYLEVKSVTYVHNHIARFPDAVTLRGRNHVETLTTLKKQGTGTGIVFICQRPDAVEFRPLWDRDPRFAEALVRAAEAGVDLACFTTRVTPKSIQLSGQIPLYLPPE